MKALNYDIDMTENGNLEIILPEKYLASPSDKYFSILYVRYFLLNVYNNLNKNIDENILNELKTTISVLDSLSIELEKILKKFYYDNAESFKLKHIDYQLSVESIEDFKKIIENNVNGEIYLNEMIFNLESGFTVLVENENIRYSYFDGEIIKIDEETE